MKQEYHLLNSILYLVKFCYRSLGYHYKKSGEVQKQDEFLRHMSGIMRLYAAILIANPCRHQQNKTHPHGLSQAWRWISCMLNMGKFFHSSLSTTSADKLSTAHLAFQNCDFECMDIASLSLFDK
jgi:hypothetical protein